MEQTEALARVGAGLWGLGPSTWRAPAQQRPEESGAELAQPDTPAGLTEPLPQPHLEEGLAR